MAAKAVTDVDAASLTLHDRLLAELGPEIVSSEIPQGTVLRIEELERRFGVSRSVIREVVRVLTSMNIVSSRRRVGLTVLGSSDWNVFDPLIIRWRLAGSGRASQLQSLGELRTAIEPMAASLAALRATPEQCGELTRAVIGMSVTAKRQDMHAYLQHDIAFHQTILEASGNEMLAALGPVVAEVLKGRTQHALMVEHPAPTAIRRHMTICDAVQSRVPEEAGSVMRAIVVEANAVTQRKLSSPAPVSGTRETSPA